MTNNTLNELKAEMNYTEAEPPRCQTCQHSEDGTDAGGGWYRLCTLNPAFHFTVQDSGRCKFHVRKVPERPAQ